MPHDPHHLARRLVDDGDTDRAARRALRALAAWAALPPFMKAAYPKEAGRIARRAAAAVLELVDGRPDHEPLDPPAKKSAPRTSAARGDLIQ